MHWTYRMPKDHYSCKRLVFLARYEDGCSRLFSQKHGIPEGKG